MKWRFLNKKFISWSCTKQIWKALPFFLLNVLLNTKPGEPPESDAIWILHPVSACNLVICSPPRPIINPTILSGTLTSSLCKLLSKLPVLFVDEFCARRAATAAAYFFVKRKTFKYLILRLIWLVQLKCTCAIAAGLIIPCVGDWEFE